MFVPFTSGKFTRLAVAWFLFLAGFAAPLFAEPLDIAEKHKIEALIEKVGKLKDAKFIRNDWSYSAANAATFLRRKWQANESRVKTARDFVERVASFSGTSGKPYLIVFKDGKETKSRDFLLTALRDIEDSAAERQGSGAH